MAWIRPSDAPPDLDQIVPVHNAMVPPVTLDVLGFIARGTKMIDDFENGFGCH